MTVREILQYRNDDLVISHVSGVGLGFVAANVLLQVRGSPLMYCQPTKLELTANQYMAILEDYVRDNPKAADNPMPPVLLVALQRVFPCR